MQRQGTCSLLSLPASSVHGILQPRILEWVVCTPPGYLPNLGIEPRSPTLQVDSLLSEPREAQNTGMGSLPSPGELPNLGIKRRSPALQENFFFF